MKHGHVKGSKTERKGASEWYKALEEAGSSPSLRPTSESDSKRLRAGY